MKHLRAALARIAGLFTRHRADEDLREELQSHLEMETAEYVRRGMTPAAARRKALMASGGLTAAAEAVRDQRGLPWADHLSSDVRYALRALRHSPVFTAVVVMTLALGIGANAAIFSVVRGVLLKPLPHRDGDGLVYLRRTHRSPDERGVPFSVPEVRDLRTGVRSLEVAEYSPWSLTLEGKHDVQSVDVGLVTGNFFEVMGLSPVLGRLTLPGDDGPHARPVMVLTHDFWMRRYGGDSSIVGTRVTLNDSLVTVIGVVQPAPYFPDRVDALVNMVVSDHHMSAVMVESRAHRMTEVLARLTPGATLEQAKREVAAVHARALREFPAEYPPASRYELSVVPFKEALGERARPTLFLLMGAAAFVMVISVANVVNLTLMRGVHREPELVVRAALGAGVARLRRLLLVENLMLALAGGLLGLLIAIGGVPLLTALAERYSPRASEIHLDRVALMFTLLLSSLVAVLLAFVAPLPREGMLAAWIAGGARQLSGRVIRHRIQRALVVAQVAVSVVLLAGAGLLTRTMIHLSAVSTGLEAEEVLTMPLTLTNAADLTAHNDSVAKGMYARMQREIRALPGVLAVGLGSSMPLRPTLLDFDVRVEGRIPRGSEAVPHADFRTASPEYFRAAGIPLLRGRGIERTDTAGGARVAIVNQAFVDQLIPHGDPLGKRIAWTGDVLQFAPVSDAWRTIVGVVGDTRDSGLDLAPLPAVFMPFVQEMVMVGGLVIRADSNAAALASAATGIVRRIAPAAPIENILTVAQIKDQSVAPRRLNAALISLFALLAAIIAAVGIAGVLAFSVSARSNEIGLRMSLGADGARVQRMILKEGGVLLVTGLLLGVAGAYVAARVIRGLLFGVAPHDPATFAVVFVMMGAIGLAACWIPARRAARIDPAITMRS